MLLLSDVTMQSDICFKVFLLILWLQIDKDNQESGGVFMIFTFLLISVFTFFAFYFTSLTDHHKNFTPSDFYHEVVFLIYLYLN